LKKMDLVSLIGQTNPMFLANPADLAILADFTIPADLMIPANPTNLRIM